MEDDRNDDTTLKGVVVITLPHADDPSQEKTITAFTVSQPHQPERHERHVSVPTSSSRSSSTSPVLSSIRKPLIGYISFAILALVLWMRFSYKGAFDFLQDSPDVEQEERKWREKRSFLFPLYRKSSDGDYSGGGDRRIREVGAAIGVDHEDQSSRIGIGVKRRSKAVANATALFSVKGNIFPDGMYYTIIHVGNPPRHYYLDVDTGSDLTWIQCDAPCISCSEGPNPLYKPTKGKLVPSIDLLCQEVQRDWKSWYCKSCSQCDYEIEYADHSSSMGVLLRDKLPLKMVHNDITSASFVFGCAYDQQGQLLSSPAKTDGILGLASTKVGLPSQLASQNIISNILGHCFSNKESTSGYMFLGDEFVPYWGMTWVPILNSHLTFYQVEVQKLSYGAQEMSPSGRGEILGPLVFDTGSTYSYFTNAAYSNLINLLRYNMDVLVQDYSDLTLPICWHANSSIRSIEEVKQLFKPLTFYFGKSLLFFHRELILQPEDYLMISKKGNVCLGILNGTEVHNGSFNILGDISLRGKLVVYDNINKKIGWIKSDCSDPQKKLSDFSVFF